MRRGLLLGVLLVAALGCGEHEARSEAPVMLGGEAIPAEVLRRGEFAYLRYCRGCHGAEGRGDGRYASSLRPRPANLTLGEYPHLGATGGELPSDDDLRRLIREGIEGTAMVPMELRDEELAGVVAYVKTLSPRWR